jgi:two-component system, OmpR family, sensor histidine kinase KdpD
MRQDSHQLSRASVRRRIQDDALSGLKSLLLVGITTIALVIVQQFFPLRHLILVYLVPVVFAAMNLGMVPAVIALIASGAATVFFFYPPIYSFLVEDPQHLIELLLFSFVAIVTGLLATNLRRHADLARRRETEMRELYAFSRRLVVAHTTSDIHTAIREHLASITGCRTILFEIVARGGGSATLSSEGRVPEPVKRAAKLAVEGQTGSGKGNVVEDGEGRAWLVQAISGKGSDFGVLAIDLGPQAGKITDTIRERIDTILADATATLERLDLAHALNDARVRSETEALREALIGSVSHQLRTPLVSILGAATVISRASGNSADPRLASLADILRKEVDRLNNEVQDLLDAALISSKGVRLDREWIEPSDIINAAVDRRQRLLSGHRVLFDVPDELPFIYGDPVLLEQALGQILDNAAKYSHPCSAITIAAGCDCDSVVLSVKDEGIGLVGEERMRLWERFFRGRHASNVSGSGLGLWIAKAFVTANGGEIEASSEGADRGTLVSIRLQAKEPATRDLAVVDDG